MKTIFTLLLSIYTTLVHAQMLSGTLVDQNTRNPIEHATIQLFDANHKSVANTITNEKGKFELRPTIVGDFTIICSFMGYEGYTQKVTLTNVTLDLGVLSLINNTNQLKAVQVTGQQPSVRLLPDKKIYEVGKDVLSQNGSISDALNGIPSVTVSPQGEITLRGNAGVTVLINGRRSGLTRGDALEQLQADQIERIEVVTSPSARYDATGNAGIINIILKKNKKIGFNGQVKAVAGLPNDTRINPSLNFKSNKINLFSTLGIRKTDYKGLYSSDQIIGSNTLSQQEVEKRHDDGKLLYLGADYFISDKHTMTAAYLWNGTKDHDLTESNYAYRNPVQDSALVRNGESKERRNYNQLEYNYTQLFKKVGQKWTVDLQYDWWDSRKDWQLGTRKLQPIALDYRNIRTNAQEANRDLLLQSDLIIPLGKETRVELGLKTENRKVSYDFLAQQQTGDSYLVYKGIDNGINYRERIHGAYAQLGSKIGKMSYLGGLRMELTDIQIEGRNNMYQNKKNYTQFFPTLHLDYAASATSTLQAHYSRRIARPSLYQLSPFADLTDLNRQEMGNPDLNPSYSDLYELGFIYRTNKLTINPSLYALRTNAPVADYTIRTTEDVFLTLPLNIGRETRQGFELNMMYTPVAGLQLNGDLNIYRFKQSGIYQNFDFNFSGSSSTGRVNAQWKLNKTLNIQGRYNYNGSSASAQSSTKSVHWADFGLGKTLLSDRMSIITDVTNLFDSRRYRTTVTGNGYSLTTMSRFNGARYRLSVVYKFKANATVREAKSGNRG
jgi:outer membrane receptor protein involved in Fe transport